MTDEFVCIVEHLEPGPMDDLASTTRLAAMLIDHDRKNNLGQYREEAVLRCTACTTAKRAASPVIRLYVAPGGERLAYFPPRLRSGGPAGSPSATVPATARNFPTLSTGVDVTQCRACQTNYVVMAEFTDGWQVHMIPAESSTFGAAQETGAPTVAHIVRNHPVLQRTIRRGAN